MSKPVEFLINYFCKCSPKIWSKTFVKKISFCLKKFFGQKKFVKNNNLFSKFGSKIFFSQQIFGLKKCLGQKKFLVIKFFWVKKLLGQKIFGAKKIWGENFFGLNRFIS